MQIFLDIVTSITSPLIFVEPSSISTSNFCEVSEYSRKQVPAIIFLWKSKIDLLPVILGRVWRRRINVDSDLSLYHHSRQMYVAYRDRPLRTELRRRELDKVTVLFQPSQVGSGEFYYPTGSDLNYKKASSDTTDTDDNDNDERVSDLTPRCESTDRRVILSPAKGNPLTSNVSPKMLGAFNVSCPGICTYSLLLGMQISLH